MVLVYTLMGYVADRGSWKLVRVDKGNVGPPRGAPTDYVDAVLQNKTTQRLEYC
jgi:hypothetical protein